jgi:serine/threonine-protein kinase
MSHAPILAPGATLAGRFTIEAPLADGSFRATDTRTGREAVLRVFAARGWSEEERDRFRRRAAAGARVAHPNVAALLGAGSEERIEWVASEALAGESLASLLAQRGTPPAPLALRILQEAAAGIAAGHAASVVHGEVHPGTIFLSRGEVDRRMRVRVLGLGARAALSVRSAAARYSAPEVLRRDEPGVAGDVFSLGVVAYEILAGMPPQWGATLAAMARGQTPQIPAPPGVAEPLADAILRALHADRARRWPDAASFASALASAASSSVAPAPGAAAAAPAVAPPQAPALLATLDPPQAAAPPQAPAPAPALPQASATPEPAPARPEPPAPELASSRPEAPATLIAAPGWTIAAVVAPLVPEPVAAEQPDALPAAVAVEPGRIDSAPSAPKPESAASPPEQARPIHVPTRAPRFVAPKRGPKPGLVGSAVVALLLVGALAWAASREPAAESLSAAARPAPAAVLPQTGGSTPRQTPIAAAEAKPVATRANERAKTPAPVAPTPAAKTPDPAPAAERAPEMKQVMVPVAPEPRTAVPAPAAPIAAAPAAPARAEEERPARIEAPDASRVYGVGEVDDAPGMVNGPDVMRELARNYPAGERGAGQVVLQFVVLENGRIDPGSVAVLESTSRAFVAPARRVIARARFAAGTVGGRPVKVRVTFPVRWNAPG